MARAGGARNAGKHVEPTEKQIQTAVIAHWRLFGTPGSLVAAIPNAHAHGQPGLTAGLPDLLVVGGDVGVGFIELKTATGKLSEAQWQVRRTIEAAGGHVAVTWGREQPITALEAWGIVRKQALPHE